MVQQIVPAKQAQATLSTHFEGQIDFVKRPPQALEVQQSGQIISQGNEPDGKGACRGRRTDLVANDPKLFCFGGKGV